MPLIFGNLNWLTVKRETDISYILTEGEKEIFLHFNQTPCRLSVGDEVEAFLYFDQKKRLCATLETPLLTTTKAGFATVVDIMPEMGVFLNIGISKDILLSKDFMGPSNTWPKIGDRIFAILKAKGDTLVARLVNKEDDIQSYNKLTVGEIVTGTVNKIISEGLGVYTNDFDYIFVHRSLIRKDYRLGESIEVTIININNNGEYNGTCIPRKETIRLDDSQMILHYLTEKGGVINLGNSSTPEEIDAAFKISKASFKRAIGHLYKQRIITIEDNRITLNNTPK